MPKKEEILTKSEEKALKQRGRKKYLKPAQKYVQEQLATMTEDQKKAFEYLTNPEYPSVFITGGAGTGKSYTLQLAIYCLREVLRLNVAVTSSTAYSANLIGGITAHRFFQFKPQILVSSKGEPTVHATATICAADVIIIDEISMIRADCFMSIVASIEKANKKRAKKGKPPIKLCVVGDFCQIPPVITDSDRKQLNEYLGYDIGEGFAFHTKAWEERQFVTVKLEQVMRQKGEDEFVHYLNKIRMGDSECFNWFNHNCNMDEDPVATTISPFNNEVKRYNQEKLAEIQGEEFVFTPHIVNGRVSNSDIEAFGIPSELHLKIGCRVMIRANAYKNCRWYVDYGCIDLTKVLYNGNTGVLRKIEEIDGKPALVIELDDSNEVVELLEKTYDIEKYAEVDGELRLLKTGDEFRAFPCCLAYAISVHKSQGCSINKINLQPHGCFASGMLYVGLSRVKGSAQNISLLDFVRPEDVMLSDSVKEFYTSIEEQRLP